MIPGRADELSQACLSRFLYPTLFPQGMARRSSPTPRGALLYSAAGRAYSFHGSRVRNALAKRFFGLNAHAFSMTFASA